MSSFRHSACLLVWLLFPLLSACSNFRLAPRTAAPTPSSSSTVSALPALPTITNFASIPGCDLQCQGCVQSATSFCNNQCLSASCLPDAYAHCVCYGNGGCLEYYVRNPISFTAFQAWIDNFCPASLELELYSVVSFSAGPSPTADRPDCAADCFLFQWYANYPGGFNDCENSAQDSYNRYVGTSKSSAVLYTSWYNVDGNWQPNIATKYTLPENDFSDDCTCYFMSTCSTYCTSKLDSSLFSAWYPARCSTFTTPFRFHPSPMPASVVSSLILRSPTWTSFIPTNTQTVPTDVVGYFSAIAPPVPPCVGSISSLCPTLYAAATDCWSFEASQRCFCSNLTEVTCTQICNDGEDPEAYMNWVTSACAQSSGSVTATAAPQFTSWVDNNYFRNLAQEHVFPWNWTVRYNSKDDYGPPGDQQPRSCPSTFSKLGAFAMINLLVLTCTVVFFRRTVIYKLTRHKCGRPGSPMWLFTGIFSASLLVASNYAAAAIVRSTPGYSSVPVAQLMLLWCSRPRISWLAVLLIWVQKEQSMYFALGASALVSEAILQTLSAVYLGQTVQFAAANGYYLVNNPVSQVPGGQGALIMYAGALLWAVSIGAAVLQIIWSFLGVERIIRGLAKTAANVPRDATEQAGGRLRRRYMVKFSQNLPKIWALFKGLGLAVSQRREITYTDMAPGNGAITAVARDRATYETRGGQGAPNTADWQNELHNMGLSVESIKRMQRVVGWMILPFLGQWLFWGGLVRLYDDLYCPPKLGILTLIWSIFATSGIYTSSAL